MHQEYHRFDSNLPKFEKVSECHFPCYSRDSMFSFTTFQMDDLESINELKDFLDYRPKSQDDIMECLSGELGAHSPNEILLSEANGIGGQEVSSIATTDSMTFVETIYIFDIFRTVFFFDLRIITLKSSMSMVINTKIQWTAHHRLIYCELTTSNRNKTI